MQLLVKSIILWFALIFLAAAPAHALQPKNRVWENFFNGHEMHLQLAAQAAESQQENTATYDKSASDTCKDLTGFYYRIKRDGHLFVLT